MPVKFYAFNECPRKYTFTRRTEMITLSRIKYIHSTLDGLAHLRDEFGPELAELINSDEDEVSDELAGSAEALLDHLEAYDAALDDALDEAKELEKAFKENEEAQKKEDEPEEGDAPGDEPEETDPEDEPTND